MDLTQNKLTRTEWNSIEVPVSESEKKILKVIMDGYADVNIRYNNHQSMLQFLHLSTTDSAGIEQYFYKEYFDKEIQNTLAQINNEFISPTSVNHKKSKKENTTQKPKKEAAAIVHEIIELLTKWRTQQTSSESQKQLKKADQIRIANMSENIKSQKPYMFEFLLMEFCDKILMSLAKQNADYGFYLYTLLQFKKLSIHNINNKVLKYVDMVTNFATQKTCIVDVFHKSPDFIEKNQYLLKYSDITLFAHQKQLFSLFKQSENNNPKLVLYCAPTGTGKTMSPIGLSQQYKIIFVCVARHVGLALAKSAITVGKKVAFAFGCDTASDIRLHYFAAVNYKVNHKSGGIQKVDNSAGQNVEIMICDVKSYLTAMHYMLAFNSEEEIITYWDEPTITMDYPEHPLHENIHQNWVNNKISKLVLSCATLPKEQEIYDTIVDFRCKFENAEIHTITSFDCKKSIALLNKDGKCCLPHIAFSEFDELKKCIANCEENKTLLRYFDLNEIVKFTKYMNDGEFIPEKYRIANYFSTISEITMDSIKMYYLLVLKHISDVNIWNIIHNHCITTQEYKFRDRTLPTNALRTIKSLEQPSSPVGQPLVRMQSIAVIPDSPTPAPATNPFRGVLLTTSDAHTLTDGPTIYLVEDVDKIGKFYIQQSKIPDRVFKEIMDKIGENEKIQKKITALEKIVEDALGKEAEKEKKMEKEIFNKDVKKAMNEISTLQSQINTVNLDSKYIPNMRQHQLLWIPDGEIVENAFVPSIEDSIIKEIMAVDVDNQMKLLLLLGIGVFNNQPNAQYMEIMKKLAMEQHLYMIIAQSDYIYGTNYQFAHGFIGKDLTNMTQQKIIQSLGRIGRNNIQQEYTVRFRDDTIIKKLLMPTEENLEAINMSRLFSS